MAVSEQKVGERASGAVMGGEPVAGTLDPIKLTNALARAFGDPEVVMREAANLAVEGVRIAAGRSSVSPDGRDLRFADPTWRDHPYYRRLGQAYLAWSNAVSRVVEGADLDWRTAERARFATNLLTSAVAPTNVFAGNPAAMKRAFETGGMSLLRGARNFVNDMVRNGGMPAQVDMRPFEVGKNLAATPGAVVHRDELFELVQYRPTTETVHARPVLMVPPQINKYYFVDLAPGRSFVEYAVNQGFQYFTISWRNPTAEHRHFGLDRYVQACLDAVDAVCEITGSDDLNVFGLCAGGITTALMLGHMAAIRDARAANATIAITILDFDARSSLGMFADGGVVSNAKRRSQRKGYLDGADLARTFTLLRPNELVWNYWINNYLMGNDPPAFDILAWNEDATRLPAALHADYLDLVVENPLTRAGGTTLLGTPIDLGKITCDTYVVAGKTDHLTPWEACYRTTQLFGGETQFVLTGTGHIQSLVNPPGNPKAKLWLGPEPGPDAKAWLEAAELRNATWWDHWADWIRPRSGEERPAPETLGSERFPAGVAAPGTYVHEK